MQDFDFFPNLIKFNQIKSHFYPIYPNCPNFEQWPKFSPNLPKKNLLGDEAASPAPTSLSLFDITKKPRLRSLTKNEKVYESKL